MKFRIGDTVYVTTGKYKGKTGAITKVLREDNKVVVEGMNKKVRHIKGQAGQPGERAEIFAPISVSNIAIVDPKDGKPSRVGFKIDEAGNKIRIAKKSGQALFAGDPRKVTSK